MHLSLDICHFKSNEKFDLFTFDYVVKNSKMSKFPCAEQYVML